MLRHPGKSARFVVRKPGGDRMLRRKTNPHLVDTVRQLKRASTTNDAPIWRAVAKALEKPNSVQTVVNVGEIQRVADDDASMIVVPGKVLGGGYLDRNVTVAAWSFSNSAKEKIETAGGACKTLSEAVDEVPAGSGVQVVA